MDYLRDTLNRETIQFHFENGWSVLLVNNVTRIEIQVIPTYVVERGKMYAQTGSVELMNEIIAEMNSSRYDIINMIARGDLYYLSKNEDDKLLDILVAIACRPIEEHLSKITTSIMVAGKK